MASSTPSTSLKEFEEIILDTPISPRFRMLNNGSICPIIGLGTERLLTKEKEDEHEQEEIIYQPIKDGTRLIDITKLPFLPLIPRQPHEIDFVIFDSPLFLAH